MQRLRCDATNKYSHLVYAELFTPFRDPDPHSKLYSVARLSHRQSVKGIVIPVNRIFRSCHLMAKCGPRIDRTWNSDTILEQCNIMYLNPYIDHHMYLFV